MSHVLTCPQLPVGRRLSFDDQGSNEEVGVIVEESSGGGGGGPPAPAISHIIYISPAAPDGFGSDVTGDGTSAKPYATIAFAQSTITAVALNEIWDIVLFPGQYGENVLMQVFTRLIGWDPSSFKGAQAPATIDGTLGLVTGVFWQSPLAQANVSNIAVTGDTTLDFVALTANEASVSFTNCSLDNVSITGSALTYVELSECALQGALSQIGGKVRLSNVTNVFSTQLHVSAAAGASTIFQAYGGGWHGDVHADQAGITDQVVSLELQGFSTGPWRVSASGDLTPSISAPMGAIPENVTLDGSAAVALSPGMRIQQRLTVPSATHINGAGMTDITLIVTPALLGATSIEQLACTVNLEEWATLMVAQKWAITTTMVNGGGPEVHLIVMSTGEDFDTGFELFVNFWAYLPTGV